MTTGSRLAGAIILSTFCGLNAAAAALRPTHSTDAHCSDEAPVAAVQTWAPPAAAPHGVHEFRASIRFVAPPNAAKLVVELWGGGGGGGGGSVGSNEGAAGGGGGGAGGYSRSVISVTPGDTYTFYIGSGGRGGRGDSRQRATGGEDGGDTYVCNGRTLIAVARGGAGGQGAPNASYGGRGGSGRPFESADAMLGRTGQDGRNGLPAPYDLTAVGGEGGRASSGSIEPSGGSGGRGGMGTIGPATSRNGTAGETGAVVVTW